MKNFSLLVVICCLFLACKPSSRGKMDEEQFASHWYQDKAEISVFDLKQMRYGEEREGEAVMIFVTEDFSKRKQVKLDNPARSGKDARKVMKLNMTRDFVTGVYPYHTMLSVFTPIYDEVNAPKIVASMSEWCGQSFIQMNWKNNAYQGQLFSYFEAESDQDFKVSGISEDEIFNLIRLNPDLVPMGHIKMIPSLIYQRLSHITLREESVKISKRILPADQAEIVVEYKEIGRRFSVKYMDVFPYLILGWQEVQIGEDGKEEITIAIKRTTKMLDYWNKTAVKDAILRKDLGL